MGAEPNGCNLVACGQIGSGSTEGENPFGQSGMRCGQGMPAANHLTILPRADEGFIKAPACGGLIGESHRLCQACDAPPLVGIRKGPSQRVEPANPNKGRNPTAPPEMAVERRS
jgi:hypothetical protein